MGENELQNALRREADGRIRAVWSEAENEVAQRRATLKAELEALRQATAQENSQEARAVRRTVTAGTEQEMRRCRLLARVALAERLQPLAERLLAELVAANREEVWQNAVAELPGGEWQRLKVHPDDSPRASRDFPQATVESDTSLLGGVIVATANEHIIIDNSLAGRLARGWPEFLPELTSALEGEIDDYGPAGPAATG